MTAVILMKNWIMSMTSTPQSPEWAAKATFRKPTTRPASASGAAEQHVGDLAGRQVHRRHDDAVEEQAEVHRAEAATTPAALPE
jgi:hypothetical protein